MNERKNILMIYPEIPTTYWSFEHVMQFINKKSVMPPLGLITVAALLPEYYDVKLVDLNIESLDINDIEKADMVFISAMIVQKDSFKNIVNICKELGAIVVAGGPYPTSSYKEITGVDHFVLNEGEITIPQFIRDYENGEAKPIYFDETKPDLQKTPMPRFDLLRTDSYANMALQNSRGCPFNCEFCDIIEMFGRKPRYKQPDRFIQELQKVFETGFRGSLFIVDDNFIGNKLKVKELLRKLSLWQKNHNYPFYFFTEASINLAQDEELMDLMVDAGFDSVFIGLETPDESILNNTNKQQNTRTNLLDSVKKIQSKGIEVQAGFILGFDNEKEDIFERQINFIQSSGIPMAMVGLMIALPNTQLYRRLEKEGRLLNGMIKGNNTHDLQLNFVPTLPQGTLIKGYKDVIRAIYKPKNYFKRVLTMMKNFPKKRFMQVDKSLTWGDIRAFLLSLIKQGISLYSLRYFSFLIKSLFINRYEFPLAVTLAIKGHHFFTITDDILQTESFIHRFKSKVEPLKNSFNSVIHSGDIKLVTRIEKRSHLVIKKINASYSRLNIRVQGQLSADKAKLIMEVKNIILNCKQFIANYNLSADTI